MDFYYRMDIKTINHAILIMKKLNLFKNYNLGTSCKEVSNYQSSNFSDFNIELLANQLVPNDMSIKIDAHIMGSLVGFGRVVGNAARQAAEQAADRHREVDRAVERARDRDDRARDRDDRARDRGREREDSESNMVRHSNYFEKLKTFNAVSSEFTVEELIEMRKQVNSNIF